MRYILFISLFFTSLLTAQTEEEYNYLTKGLKIQEESGLDMKKGYSFELIRTSSIPKSYRFKFQYLINPEGRKVFISVVATHPTENKKWYIAIPVEPGQTQYWLNYITFLKSCPTDMLVAYSYAASTIPMGMVYSNK